LKANYVAYNFKSQFTLDVTFIIDQNIDLPVSLTIGNPDVFNLSGVAGNTLRPALASHFSNQTACPVFTCESTCCRKAKRRMESSVSRHTIGELLSITCKFKLTTNLKALRPLEAHPAHRELLPHSDTLVSHIVGIPHHL
jgi:hypothetical protein